MLLTLEIWSHDISYIDVGWLAETIDSLPYNCNSNLLTRREGQHIDARSGSQPETRYAATRKNEFHRSASVFWPNKILSIHGGNMQILSMTRNFSFISAGILMRKCQKKTSGFSRWVPDSEPSGTESFSVFKRQNEGQKCHFDLGFFLQNIQYACVWRVLLLRWGERTYGHMQSRDAQRFESYYTYRKGRNLHRPLDSKYSAHCNLGQTFGSRSSNWFSVLDT